MPKKSAALETQVQWTETDRARHAAIRAKFANRPNQEELLAGGDFVGPAPLGLVTALRELLFNLKSVRERLGITLSTVSQKTGIDQATLSRLENGRQPNPTVDTLTRYSEALGKRLVFAIEDLDVKV